MNSNYGSTPLLRGALLARAEHDRQLRRALGNPPISAQQEAVRRLAAGNTRWLAHVIDTHGWPGIRLVGPDGAHAAWLLAQHAAPECRARWLPLLRDAVENGDAPARDLAYLHDRVQADSGRGQRYGTQWMVIDGSARLWPIQNPANVNDRRTRMRLPPLKPGDITGAWPLPVVQHPGVGTTGGTG